MKIKELMTKEDLKWHGIGACNKVLETEYVENAVVYTALTPDGYNYNGFQKGTARAYVCKDNSIQMLFCNLKPHRAKQAIKAWKNGDVGTVIPMWVWENYITNGYNTRRGLYADYFAKEDRIKRIAKSHVDYMLYETGDSKVDHDNRVAMRNN